MAKAKEIVAQYRDIDLEHHVGVMPQCSNCGNWAPAVNSGGVFGQCLFSGKFASAPMTTTDRTSCSAWVARG